MRRKSRPKRKSRSKRKEFPHAFWFGLCVLVILVLGGLSNFIAD